MIGRQALHVDRSAPFHRAELTPAVVAFAGRLPDVIRVHEERGGEPIFAQQRIGVEIDAVAVVVEGQDQRFGGDRCAGDEMIAQSCERYHVEAAGCDRCQLSGEDLGRGVEPHLFSGQHVVPYENRDVGRAAVRRDLRQGGRRGERACDAR
jgi:hypothetical protein